MFIQFSNFNTTLHMACPKIAPKLIKNGLISCAGAQYSKEWCFIGAVPIHMARRAGVPSGEARRVILRDLKIGSNWKPKNRFKNVSVMPFFDLRLARISILIKRHRISDSRRFRENLSRLHLSAPDGTTGGQQHDFVAQNKPA